MGRGRGNDGARDIFVKIGSANTGPQRFDQQLVGPKTVGFSDGFNTDVFTNIDGSGTTQPSDAARSTSGVVVGFDFNPNLLPVSTSYLLIVDTNATSWVAGPMSVIDDNTFTTPGFAPAATPEPSTLSLLGTGLLAAGAGLRRKMRRA